ncbi:hypothetical protein [Deinococcus kurensis]|uniref:hypothetical protein n=1 Tax=Deinococcus kurensis TaxID=2662757 RepID=UPI0012D2D3C2|nr:hypothetical protein [Deinococcus kurensis]
MAELRFVRVHVGDRTVLWESQDHRAALNAYVESMTTGTLRYQVALHVAALDDEKHRFHAAMSLRQVYMQALETLMALLCGMLQGGGGLPMWMVSYTNKELRTLVQQLTQGQRLPGAKRAFDFEGFAAAIMQDSVEMGATIHPDEADGVPLADAAPDFAAALRRLCADFLNEELHAEYNSIKHGVRAVPGSLQLRFRADSTEKWHVLDMPYGSTYPKRVQGSVKPRMALKTHTAGYDPAQVHARTLVCLDTTDVLRAYARGALGKSTEGGVWIAATEAVDAAWGRGNQGALINMTTDLL